jgi:Flp pilus assembly pilin Flp
MKQLMSRVTRNEDGMTTAEYAVGTVAAAGLGGILIKLLASEEVREMLLRVISAALSQFFGG